MDGKNIGYRESEISGKNGKKFEMSRYIDLDVYHNVERSHPYYAEMTAEILNQIRIYKNGDERIHILEIGCGTGLMTEELLGIEGSDIDAVEIDSECFEIIRKNMNGRVKCICDDAVTFRRKNFYDIAVSSFAHDHIHYERRYDFAANIRANLIRNGLYIMGGEILPYYMTTEERIGALYKYHEMIIRKALRNGDFRLAQIEINALESGIYMIGDFKRHESMFEEEMLSADFKIKEKLKMGPHDTDDEGGVFVYVFQAI